MLIVDTTEDMSGSTCRKLGRRRPARNFVNSVMKTTVTNEHTASTRKCSMVATALLMCRLYLQAVPQSAGPALLQRHHA